MDTTKLVPILLMKIYAEYKSHIIHVHIATDLENDNIRIVTTYKPTLDKWESNFKIRRK